MITEAEMLVLCQRALGSPNSPGLEPLGDALIEDGTIEVSHVDGAIVARLSGQAQRFTGPRAVCDAARVWATQFVASR
jgi:hypothetical protein